MFKLLIVFAHLLAVCLAIGTVLLTDLRLLRRAAGTHIVIEPPSRFETQVVGWALGVMCITGAVLIGLDLENTPGPLTNAKLHAKLVLVAVLMLNAWVLHRHVFPWLKRGTAVSRWTGGQRWFIALAVGLSNSLWLFCAFLGIARPWNHNIEFGSVLAIAAGLWALATLTIRGVLAMASREEAFEQTLLFERTQQFEKTQQMEPLPSLATGRRGGGSWGAQPAQQRRTRY